MFQSIPWRKIHRWLGLLIGIQVLFWMASGLYFALVPIESVRGEHLTTEPVALAATELQALLPPGQALAALQLEKLDGISLKRLRGKLVYKVSFLQNDQPQHRLLDARDGRLLPQLGTPEAQELAVAALREAAPVKNIQRIESHQPGSEYRGRSLPLYRVDFDHPDALRIYLDAWTGEVVARRTSTWRIFDFLWMLHILDFQERDNFNQPLLQFMALAGLLIVITGYALWWLTSVFVKRRRSKLASAG